MLTLIKNNRFSIILIITCLLFALACYNQDETIIEVDEHDQIAGTIYDSMTSEPLNGVDIWVDENKTQTDNNGTFTLKNVADGITVLHIKKPCYPALSLRFEKNGKTTINKSILTQYHVDEYDYCSDEWNNEVTGTGTVCFFATENGLPLQKYIGIYGTSGISVNFLVDDSSGKKTIDLSEGRYLLSTCITSNNSFSGKLEKVMYFTDAVVTNGGYEFFTFDYDRSDYIVLSGTFANSLNVMYNSTSVGTQISFTTVPQDFLIKVFQHHSNDDVVLHNSIIDGSEETIISDFKGPFYADTTNITFNPPDVISELDVTSSSLHHTFYWEPLANADFYGIKVNQYDQLQPVLIWNGLTKEPNFTVPQDFFIDTTLHVDVIVFAYVIDNFTTFLDYLSTLNYKAFSYRESIKIKRNIFDVTTRFSVEKKGINDKLNSLSHEGYFSF